MFISIYVCIIFYRHADTYLKCDSTVHIATTCDQHRLPMFDRRSPTEADLHVGFVPSSMVAQHADSQGHCQQWRSSLLCSSLSGMLRLSVHSQVPGAWNGTHELVADPWSDGDVGDRTNDSLHGTGKWDHTTSLRSLGRKFQLHLRTLPGARQGFGRLLFFVATFSC